MLEPPCEPTCQAAPQTGLTLIGSTHIFYVLPCKICMLPCSLQEASGIFVAQMDTDEGIDQRLITTVVINQFVADLQANL